MGRKRSNGPSKCSLSRVSASNSVCNRSDTISVFACREWRKPRKNWAKVIGVTVESRTRHASEQYCWANPQEVSSLQLPELFQFTISAWHRLQSSIYRDDVTEQITWEPGAVPEIVVCSPDRQWGMLQPRQPGEMASSCCSIDCCTVGLIV
jgi:hypothetical protein